MHPTLLALETSSARLSVALKKGEESVREASLDGFLSHAENLLPMIEKLLREADVKLEAIDTFLIGQGPGSFTGLRIGFATLKGFQAIKTKPCFGALSFELIAQALETPTGTQTAVCLDAHRSKYYFQLFEKIESRWKALAEPAILPFEEVIARIPQNACVTGNALERYKKDFEEKLADKKVRFLEEKYWYPGASTLILCETKKDPCLHLLTQPEDFAPRYLRLSEPEEKRQNQKHARKV